VPRPAAQRTPAAPRTARPEAATAAAYVALAASIDLFVLRSSELALERSSSARIRAFAKQEIASHNGLGSQLSFAGRRLNLLPSARLRPEHQALLDRLETARDFDATYRQEQLQVHRQALTLHANYAAGGGSPTLRPVAKAAVPIIDRHLRLIGGLY
jgi:putative membrane protein